MVSPETRHHRSARAGSPWRLREGNHEAERSPRGDCAGGDRCLVGGCHPGGLGFAVLAGAVKRSATLGGGQPAERPLGAGSQRRHFTRAIGGAIASGAGVVWWMAGLSGQPTQWSMGHRRKHLGGARR